MPVQLKQGYGRIVAARQRLVEVRAARWETLQRFKSYAKGKLADFVGTTDPVSGQRFVDISAGGDKARGEAAMVLGFFDGTKLRLTVDASGQFGSECNPPELLAGVARIVDVVVPTDLSTAVLFYEAASAPPGTIRKLDLYDVIVRMVEHTAAGVEAELGDAGREVGQKLAVPPVTVPAKTAFSFSVG
jgi:hypothetical protein